MCPLSTAHHGTYGRLWTLAIGISHDDHIAFRMARAPLFDPEKYTFHAGRVYGPLMAVAGHSRRVGRGSSPRSAAMGTIPPDPAAGDRRRPFWTPLRRRRLSEATPPCRLALGRAGSWVITLVNHRAVRDRGRLSLTASSPALPRPSPRYFSRHPASPCQSAWNKASE
jgi:hypothetical protein